MTDKLNSLKRTFQIINKAGQLVGYVKCQDVLSSPATNIVTFVNLLPSKDLNDDELKIMAQFNLTDFAWFEIEEAKNGPT